MSRHLAKETPALNSPPMHASLETGAALQVVVTLGVVVVAVTVDVLGVVVVVVVGVVVHVGGVVVGVGGVFSCWCCCCC